jgi:ferrochelatase
MAYGTPSSPDAVEEYYTRIRHGHAPSSEQLADLVRRYDAIGGISPLAERTGAQVAGIAAHLHDKYPGQFDVRFGSKYEPPMLEETAQSFLDSGVSTVIGLVLAPHESSMSTRQYFERAEAVFGSRVQFIPIRAWWMEPQFLELIAERVMDALGQIPMDRRESTEVIFSAHSLPQRIISEGDTYPDQLRDSARLAAQLAGVLRWDTAWQSAGRTADPWIGPDILAVLRDKFANGVTDVVSCPIGFVSDHLEVLFDLDVEAAGVANELGLGFVRTASLNDDPQFTAFLADLVARAR